jgi:hypothetical protein
MKLHSHAVSPSQAPGRTGWLLVAIGVAALLPAPASALITSHEPDEPPLVVWWPAHLAAAARLYQCSVAESLQGRHSVMVWTTGRRQVLALGPALAGGELPAYVLPIVNPAYGSAGDPIRVALRGYEVKTVTVKMRESRASLQVAGTALGCVATSDD